MITLSWIAVGILIGVIGTLFAFAMLEARQEQRDEDAAAKRQARKLRAERSP